MTVANVADLIQHDHWAGARGCTVSNNRYVVRWRTPVLTPGEARGYETLLQVVWRYGETGAADDMPDDAELAAMQSLENQLIAIWELDTLAVLTAVMTMDGAREWVVYTRDAPTCIERLNATAQGGAPFPIELHATDDPLWSHLRDRIVGPAALEADDEIDQNSRVV